MLGASHDSAQAFAATDRALTDQGGPWRPPLAKDLFLDRNEWFGKIVREYADALAPVLPYLRDQSGTKTVEEKLEELQAQVTDYPQRKRQLYAVKFYLCHLMTEITREWIDKTSRITNYAGLVDGLLRFNRDREPILLVTFNYDLLLEDALDGFGFNRNKSPDDYLDSHGILKVLRLHGSIAWSRTVDTQGQLLQPRELIARGESLHPTDSFISGNASTNFRSGRPSGSIVPAIAIPVQTKTESDFECPAGHREYLVKMLPKVTKILIVGWQAKEAHFTDMLRGKLPELAHLMAVGRDKMDSKNVLNSFLRQIGKTNVPHTFYGEAGFTHFVVSQEGEEFLRY